MKRPRGKKKNKTTEKPVHVEKTEHKEDKKEPYVNSIGYGNNRFNYTVMK
jgi:hypothetical protein